MTVDVDSNEVAGMRDTVAMPHHGIGLKRARSAVVPIVLGDLPPLGEHGQEHPTGKHGEHEKPNKDHPMQPPARALLGRLRGVSSCWGPWPSLLGRSVR